MTRHEAVRAAVKAYQDAPFDYGTFDCCEFVRQVAIQYRGEDPAPSLSYKDEEGAQRIIEEHGGLSGLMTFVFGDPIEPDDAQVADAVLLRLPKTGPVMGVKVADGALVPVKLGLWKVPLRYALEGWRI